MYEDDQDLLEDVLIENKQAIEMAEIYSHILSGMMNTFSSVISNNLNSVMKLLTSITIILSLPTMVSSFFGMNVKVPFEGSPRFCNCTHHMCNTIFHVSFCFGRNVTFNDKAALA